MKGLDILARAKTGSGKTVAFLLPSIETVLRLGPASANAVSVLVISPTRELAGASTRPLLISTCVIFVTGTP
jgi:ATP-dependent RNA helicase MSS116